MNQMPDHVRSGPNYPYPVNQTYTPDWEGYLRLAYHPGSAVTLFGQVNYTGKMYTMLDKISSSNPSAVETRQNSLTTVGLGGKYRFPSGVQITIGCNDIFNRGPKVHQRYSQSIFGGLGGDNISGRDGRLSAAGTDMVCYGAV